MMISRHGLSSLTVYLCCLLLVHVSADHYNVGRQGQSYIWLRGGSSPFPLRTPPTVQGRPGQQSSNQQKSFVSIDDEDDEHEEELEDDASTRTAIDAFLTRDSRNSFIGTLYILNHVSIVLSQDTELRCVVDYRYCCFLFLVLIIY